MPRNYKPKIAGYVERREPYEKWKLDRYIKVGDKYCSIHKKPDRNENLKTDIQLQHYYQKLVELNFITQ